MTDDNGTPGNTGDDISVCTISGPLAPGASATCTTTLNISADRTNIATTTGTPSNPAGQPLGVPTVSDTDDAVVDVINPSVQVVKTAASAADGTTLYMNPPGGNVLYTYAVKNTGDTSLTNIVVTDDNGTPGSTGDDFTVCTITAPLAPGASTTCTTTLNITADHTNIATATGTPSNPAGTPLGVPPVSDTDNAVVDIVNPKVQVVKTAANAADGATLYLLAPGPVLYTYVVQNTGDTHLVNIPVVDDNGTPGVPGDDIIVCTITTPLAPGASTTCTTTINITVDRTNIATVTGTPSNPAGQPLGIPTVSDTDDAVVDVLNPSVQVVKTAANAADGATVYVQPGANVTYTYVWTNTGGTYLKNVVVKDDNGTPGVPGDDFVVCSISGPVAPNFTFTCTVTRPISVNTTNIATITADPVDGSGNPLPGVQPVTDTDDAIVLVYSTIGDFVWWDLNGNGQQDTGEPGIPDVTVELYNSAGALIGTDVTDAAGKYDFGTLVAGNYTVKIANPEFTSGQTLFGWTAAPQNVGNDATDSDGNPTTHDAAVTLPAGVVDNTTDFGFVNPATTWTVTKTLDPTTPSPVRVGNQVKFIVTVVNNGPGWIGVLPLQDVYDKNYLTYGYSGQWSTPISVDNLDDGQIDWNDLTVALGDVPPGGSVQATVRFTAKADTTTLQNSQTINQAIVSGALIDLDGPTGPLPPAGPTTPKNDTEPVQVIQPTGITLAGFSVAAADGGILVTWNTVSEHNIVGFKVARGSASLGDFVNAAKAGTNEGTTYKFLDKQPGTGRYALEVYKLDGSVERVDLGSPR